MRTVNDEALHKHSRDLFLYALIVGFREEMQHDAREVVSVAVRIAQLVSYSIEQHVSRLCPQVCDEPLIYFHVGRVCERRQLRRHLKRSLRRPEGRNGCKTYVKHEGVDNGDARSTIRLSEPRPQFKHESERLACREERVEVGEKTCRNVLC